jgi:nucleotide-binding universal stress UspA family protein
MEFRRVVIATDFSERSLLAARWAARNFAGGLDIVLVHAVTLPEPPPFLRGRFPNLPDVEESARLGALSRLREVARSLSASSVRSEVRIGHAAEQVAAVAREVGADAIVVGRHGDRPGVLHRLGTTADRLVKIAPAPVLLVTGQRDIATKHILVALDDADITRTVVDWSRLLAGRFNADITALHVVHSAILSHIAAGACGRDEATSLSPSEIRAQVCDEGIRWMLGLFDDEPPTPSINPEVAFGMIAHEIVAAAERRRSDLIVLGRTGAGLARRPTLGSVAHHVLHTARCPVLVVVEPEDDVVDDENTGWRSRSRRTRPVRQPTGCPRSGSQMRHRVRRRSGVRRSIQFSPDWGPRRPA